MTYKQNRKRADIKLTNKETKKEGKEEREKEEIFFLKIEKKFLKIKEKTPMNQRKKERKISKNRRRKIRDKEIMLQKDGSKIEYKSSNKSNKDLL